MVRGALYVIKTGMTMMLLLFADNWDIPHMVETINELVV